MPHDGAWRSYKNLTVGLKNRVQMLNTGTTPKLYFPVNKLQRTYLLISNNLCERVKSVKRPTQIAPSRQLQLLQKKITSILLISITEL